MPPLSLPLPCLLPVWAPPEAAIGCEQVKAATLGLPDTAALQFNEANPDAQREGLAESGWGRHSELPAWARPGPLAPAQLSSPARFCTVPALQGSRQQTPWPCVHAAPGCLSAGVGVAEVVGGGLGGTAPSGRIAAWSTTCPAELAGDRAVVSGLYAHSAAPPHPDLVGSGPHPHSLCGTQTPSGP